MSAKVDPEIVDWRQFVARICIRSAPKIIYRAWATESGLAEWCLATGKFRPDGRWRDPDEPACKGDGLEWTWVGNKDFVLKGKVLAADGEKTFAFTFGQTAEVEVIIKPNSERCLVCLTQSNMSDSPEGRSDYVDGLGGWTFYLANLKSVLEGGPDLRERDSEIWEVLNR